MQVVTSGLLTTYKSYGKGAQTILFLHGWADSSLTFETLAKNLINENKKLKIYTLDLPGFGGTQSPDQAWNLKDYSSFISEFINKLQITPQVIIGHSNGGAIAIDGLASGKLNAEKLVLLASAGIRDPSIKKSILKIASVPTKVGMKALPKAKRLKLRQKLYKSIGSDYLVADGMQDTFKRIVSSDVSKSAESLNMPTLLIYGQNDDATPPELGKRLKDKIKKSKIEILPETGHFLHQEQVYKVSKLIQDFVK